jgi:hypothetical protein
MDEEVKVYDLVAETWPFKLRDHKTGELQDYHLKELVGLERDQYMNRVTKVTKVNADGRGGTISDFVGLYSGLLARCVVHTDTGKPETEIQRWPARMQEDLYKRAQRLSGLDPKTAEADAKNG